MKKIFTTAIALGTGLVLMAQTSAELKLNLEKNKTYRVKSNTEQNITIVVGGNSQQVETKSISSISFKPKAIGADFIQADVQFDTTITKVSMPATEMNSTKPGSISSTNTAEVMNYIYNRYSKLVFNVKLSLSGKVLEISNIKALADDFNKSLDSLQGQIAMQKGQLAQLVSEAAVKGNIESITGYLTGKQVNVGDKWTSNLTMSASGMGMTIASNYKLKKLTGTLAEISGESTIEPSSSEPTQLNGMPVKYDIRGLGKSTVTADTKSGWVKKSSSKIHLQGNMTVTAQGNDMQIPVEIDSTTDLVALP